MLFTPIDIGSIRLKNRLVFCSVNLNLPKEDSIEYLRARARGGAGLVFLPSVMIMPDAPERLFHIYSDEFIPELSRAAQAIHAEGAMAALQIQHWGRQSLLPKTPVAPSPIACPVVRRVPRELTKEEIADLIEQFAQAIRRVQEAGFDMAEIHAAHGYLVSQFLSARSNQRSDEYGQDIKGRARFLTETITLARQKVGNTFPISIRLNGSDNIEGGLTVEESKVIAQLAQEAGVSMLNISGGVNRSYPLTIPPFYAPEALYVEPAAEIKKVVRIPVCVAGRISRPELAEQILQQGKVDLIGMGRPLLADPELPNKALKGESEDIRPCLSCNQGCSRGMTALGMKLKSTCTVNPELGKEGRVSLKPATRTKKVLVIGGGIAGLEVARVASLRGHKVVVYEKKEALGGQWPLASTAPGKESYSLFLKWLIRQVEKSGAKIKLDKAFTMDDLDEELPDVTIIATGASPFRPNIPGIDRAVTAWEVLERKVGVGEKVLIVGGSGTGLETAHFLAAQGKKVTLIEATVHIGKDLPSAVRWHLRHLLDSYGVRLLRRVELKEIRPAGPVVKTRQGERLLTEFNSVVLAVGARPNNELESFLRSKVAELYTIGDAKLPRTGLEAIAEANQIGLNL